MYAVTVIAPYPFVWEIYNIRSLMNFPHDIFHVSRSFFEHVLRNYTYNFLPLIIIGVQCDRSNAHHNTCKNMCVRFFFFFPFLSKFYVWLLGEKGLIVFTFNIRKVINSETHTHTYPHTLTRQAKQHMKHKKLRIA